MQKKFIKTYILGAVLAISIIALLFPRFTNHQAKEKKVDRKLFSFETKDIDKIDLEYFVSGVAGGKKIVQLKKVDDNWVDATNHNYLVVKSDVDTLLEKADSITSGDVVSKNPERQVELEVSGDKGARVKLSKSENMVADFWLGKTGPTGGTYFRLEGNDLVYNSKDNIRFYFTKPDWIDKTIAKQDQESINKVVINTTAVPITLEKGEKKEGQEKAVWQMIAPSKMEVDANKIDSMLNSLSNLMAQEVVFDKTLAETGLENSKKFIEANTVKLIIGAKQPVSVQPVDDMGMGGDQSGYYAKLENSTQIFVVPAYLIEAIFSSKVDDWRVVK